MSVSRKGDTFRTRIASNRTPVVSRNQRSRPNHCSIWGIQRSPFASVGEIVICLIPSHRSWLLAAREKPAVDTITAGAAPISRISAAVAPLVTRSTARLRSEEHTSELQSLLRISYAVFCLKKKKEIKHTNLYNIRHERQATNTRLNYTQI